MIVDLWRMRFLCVEMHSDGSIVKPLVRGTFDPPERLLVAPGSVGDILLGASSPERLLAR